VSVVSVRETLTLERAIERELNLGQKDPHVIYDRLAEQLGPKALFKLAVPHLPDMIGEMARQRLNQQRRNAIAKIDDSNLAQPEIMLKSLWVPSEDGIVYKRIADMDDRDFDDRAAYLERMVLGISRHAQWCRDVAEAIRKHKVGVAGDLERLPGLPELEP
jgi:hypothetical protein